ncbi:MAG: DUF2214 family protein [Bdellovibrionota bacterium]
MFLASLLAALHYVALGLGLAGLFLRGTAIKSLPPSPQASDLRILFLGDNLWGVAAGLWIVTGLLRAFAGIEKTSEYYLHNGFFYVKLGLFLLIFLLELRPMILLIRWRLAIKKNLSFDGVTPLQAMRRINSWEIALTLCIPFVAAAMARGLWLFA